ncbi:MAG: hypothetical protein GY716_13475 [bacterium]|nr:hypothetical protein [bacterium]
MPTAEKLDLFKLHRDQYVARKKPVLVDIPEVNYLVAQGRGEPGGEQFQTRVAALYAAAYTLKFTSKAEGRDFVVSKLEGLCWTGKSSSDFGEVPKSEWNWKLMIRRPDFIGAKQLETAVAAIRDKGKTPEIEAVTLDGMSEGRCVQMLHVGPYEREGETRAVMLAFAEEQGLAPGGLHHEIYLSDPRRVEPARLKTILRQPVR